MIWLAWQLWPWLAISAALGAGTTAALTLRRVPVERWVAVPGEDADAHGGRTDALDVVDVVAAATARRRPVDAPTGQAAGVEGAVEDAAPATVDGWPFPLLAGHNASYRPWEAEELWSRPVHPAIPGAERGPRDAWTEAASSWRSWAEEAVNRTESRETGVDDDDLFAADREAERLGLDAGVLSTSLGHLVSGRGGSDGRGARADPALDEDPFPYAEPVEAPGMDNVEPFPQAFRTGRISA